MKYKIQKLKGKELYKIIELPSGFTVWADSNQRIHSTLDANNIVTQLEAKEFERNGSNWEDVVSHELGR